MTLLYI